MEVRRELLLGDVRLDFGLIDVSVEGPTVAEDDDSDEERAGEVAPEAEKPMQQHFPDAEAAVENSNGGVQECACAQVGTGETFGGLVI